MANDVFPKSQLPIRKTEELLPQIFKTPANKKFLAGVVDPLVQPGTLEKNVGYIGRRYGTTFRSDDLYLDSDETLRSRYQLEPGVVIAKDGKNESFYDYLDFKNQLKFFGNNEEQDSKVTSQVHYTWNPPIDWDKFVNYREYYWVPSGPPPVKVLGQNQEIISSYRVGLGVGPVFIFSPDSVTNNPSLTLYRGQTYKFVVRAPGHGFAIRKNIDTGALIYDPRLPYVKGQIVIYDGDFYECIVERTPPTGAPGTPIDLSSGDWKLLETIEDKKNALDYSIGVTNNRTENGTITFKVPLDAPDVLFYQSLTEPDRYGKFIIGSVEENTKIDVEKEVLGKNEYVSSNGIAFTNGLVVRFEGQVTPEKYSKDTWLVEGVGDKITLTRFFDLVVSTTLTRQSPEVLFDDGGFDTQPFDDASAFPGDKDYITVSKASKDSNPWSRYNRWFHRSVLDYSYGFNNSDFEAPEESRAKRPIIEFKSNLQLFNHGAVAKTTVDYIDNFTEDVFSIVEGSSGYNIDSEDIFPGARVLITADKDSLVNNQIYVVNLINHNGKNQISLLPAEDAVPVLGDCVLIRRGKNNRGLMYHFNGEAWIKSQVKDGVNQPPLFDMFDDENISFSDEVKYPVTSFKGTRILGYKEGTGVVDTELGFSLSYLNINNVGDIRFDFTLEQETFQYQLDRKELTKKLSTGYYKFNEPLLYLNGWSELRADFTQAIVDTIIVEESTNRIVSNIIDWESVNEQDIVKTLIYKNGTRCVNRCTREGNVFIFQEPYNKGDIVTFKVYGNVEPDKGYYEIPRGLERNPLNQEIQTFTLGQATDHVASALDFVDVVGTYPGRSNLRDLSNFQDLSRRFLKHSGISPLALLLLCDKEVNIIKSIQYAKKSYTDFKNNFIKLADELYFDQSPIDYVDTILEEMSRTKTSMSAFAGSDMVGSGAYSAIDYIVDDPGIKTFALSQKFSLDELSSRAVYVYVNNNQLLVNRDYEFNSTFGFINLLIQLNEFDKIQIREYVSTGINFIPPTPTTLGLFKKYVPRKFLDDTYTEPKEVIQGHDGSITIAYGDYRDDVLLELEYRIYNNIKQQYNEKIFDIDSVLGGYYGNSLYNKSRLDSIVIREFLTWISGTNIDYVNNIFFDSENSFTYTYNNMLDPQATAVLPGYWRGVYKWFYDTDRPHTCPWEMLGFSEKPTWWEDQYGPAPYTSNNLLLWEDLRDGVIRQGSRAGTYPRYQRASIMSHLPVDSDGNLLSPLDSSLARDFVLLNANDRFFLGDVSPTEYAWRSSSEWPFAVISALCLLKPYEFITDSFNRSQITTNNLNQTVNKSTGLFTVLSDIIIPEIDTTPVTGLVLYVTNYLKSNAVPVSRLKYKIENLDVKLSHRLSGFVDQRQQKFLLDSKNPNSQSTSIFVPDENYDIVFNVSSPISEVVYSGIIVEKANTGWKISGYDSLKPFFTYYEAVPSSVDPLISVGGVSENFLEWSEERFYGNGVLVRYQEKFYRSIKSHNSERNFDLSLWKQLPGVPQINAVEALKRNNFNRLSTKTLVYGTILTSIQQVVDFFLGYQEYLKSQGVVFDQYDVTTQTTKDWLTAVKEFMFWSKHNWSEGSLITFSPAASYLEFNLGVGVVDNLLDSFYGYQVLKNDGLPLRPDFINVDRSFKKLIISTENTNDGIYYFRGHLVLKEHVAIFDDRTVFNDVIYDKPTGYRQERIKSRGFRTVDWDGDYTSPGFLFDNVDIAVWQPFVDYRLGDIVAYKSFYWTSQETQLGSEEFNDSLWSKLDSIPEKKLVENFDYRINQFEDYYDVESDGIGTSQRDLARHLIGYQPREYLQNIAEDSISQFRIYQGFIKEKGTSNAVVKVFDKLSRAEEDSIVLNEEWAFQVGTLGGVDQPTEYEFSIEKDRFNINPQPVLLLASEPSGVVTDQYIRVPASKFTIRPDVFNPAINPVIKYEELTRNAGYVNLNDVNHILKTRDDLLTFDINSLKQNDEFWITFDNASWTVLRYFEPSSLRIDGIAKENNQVTISLNSLHSIKNNDIIGIKGITNLTGFYKVINTLRNTVTVEYKGTLDPEFEDSTVGIVGLLISSRHPDYASISPEEVATLPAGSKLWIDDDGLGDWKVVEKKKQYTDISLVNYGISDPIGLGESVIYIDSKKQIVTTIPRSGFVMVYTDSVNTLRLKQTIAPPAEYESSLDGVFGKVLATSPDNKFLIIGSPLASGVTSRYRGELNPLLSYIENEIVLYQGKLWRCVVERVDPPDGSSITFSSQDWEPATLVEASSVGRGEGYFEQGMVSIYEYRDDKWDNVQNILSPRPVASEHYGSQISISGTGGTYYMAVSALGAVNEKGRVYLYKYSNGSWSHLENQSYAGVYNSSAQYPKGAVVWYDSRLFQATIDVAGDTSTIGVESNIATDSSQSSWILLDSTATQCSLPSSMAIDDFNENTLISGLFEPDQIVEFVKEGDKFGFDTALSRDGKILVVGTPFSDGQYFVNYKGIWSSYQEYVKDSVVKYSGNYYKLVQDSSLNDIPNLGSPWELLAVESDMPAGKVYIYVRDANEYYKLTQTITIDSMSLINENLPNETLTSGDNFGFSVDIDFSGTVIIVSAPEASIESREQGAVYVFRNSNVSTPEFKLVQKLQSYEDYFNEYFGSAIRISAGTEKIVVGARNSRYSLITRFENNTIFDGGATTFSEAQGFPGQVYVFERKDNVYFLTEKLETDFVRDEAFGSSVDATDSVILVGSPSYTSVDGSPIGKIRLFRKEVGSSSLNVLSSEKPLVDISKFKNIEIYDDEKKIKISDIDIVDHYKLKILNIAEQELKFKTIYDPAFYDKGNDDVVVDADQAWFEKHVGELWWDLNTVKFLNYEQSDISYRIGNWNSFVEGSTIDVYEWVESPLLPSEWSILADTTEGLAEGISGQPKYPDDSVYNEKIIINPNTGDTVGSKYYYWVKNKTTIPDSNTGRTLSSASVQTLISNPVGSGVPFFAAIDADKFLIYNVSSILPSDNALINIEYVNDPLNENIVHREYQLLTEGVADSLPTEFLEKKWIDSLIGFDEAGNSVPDQRLPEKQKYGLKFRPRQTMFANRYKALKIAIDNTNSILLKRPFKDLIDFTRLNTLDPVPSAEFKEYDTVVEDYVDLLQVGTVRVRQAILRPNLINGKIDTIDIVDPGFGYKVAPFIDIEGDGKSATATITIDGQGRVNSVTLTNRGRKYNNINIKIRPFSVLVRNDSTAGNRWSIYSWDQQRKSFFRSKTQSFDTKRYWSYVDWWAEGFNENSRIIKEINSFYEESGLSIKPGDLIRIKEYGDGGWAVLERTDDGQGNSFENYNLVGRQGGTIQISKTLYDQNLTGLGYDIVSSYDADLYDLQPARELRVIFEAIKNDIFVDDLRVEWNKLFFSSIKYAYSEQEFIDWAFKTSFLNAIHNIGPLDQRVNYTNDNLESYQKYLEEVKPFRSTIREYTSRYTNIESTNSAMTDFDLPASFSSVDGKILPATENSEQINQYPWKWWLDNKGYSIVEILVADSGGDYTDPPKVLIEGDGSGATAQAYVSNQKVSGIRVLTEGSGYTKTPKVTLVGGNGTSTKIAKVSPILGKSKVRTFDMTVKFDRISKTGIYQNFIQVETFEATGLTAVFDLKYPPTRDKSKIDVAKNGQIVLNTDYEIIFFESYESGYTLLKGKLRFFVPPVAGDVIKITYDKNEIIFDSINRIDRFYEPEPGMKGKEKNQLMTGIDFGGIQIQGTTFDVTGGWDALPWYTDGWDSVESSSDYYYVADGSTTFVILPYTPVEGQLISIYLKKINESRPTRIDDPYWDRYDGSTIQINGRVRAPEGTLMPSFIGDGSTNIVQFHDPVSDLPYVSLSAGDTVIFRTIDSDGSVTITDINLLDTRLSGGSFETINGAYSTATGRVAEDITIDGEKFISPDQVPAPEENVPGQVLDSLSIKVYSLSKEGSAPLQNRVLVGNGTDRIFDIGLEILEGKNVLVYVDKIKKLYKETAQFVGEINGTTLTVSSVISGYIQEGMIISAVNVAFGTKILSGSGNVWQVDLSQTSASIEMTGVKSEFEINFDTNQVEFLTVPSDGSIIEIVSVGIGGIGLLDYQEFTGDGETILFLTNAAFADTRKVFVTVNGDEVSSGFINSAEAIDVPDKTMIQLGVAPAFNAVIKIVCFAFYDSAIDNLPLIRVNKQKLILDSNNFDITSLSFTLDSFVNLQRSSEQSAVIVERNGKYLKNIDTEYFTYDGTNNEIVVGLDPAEAIGAITSGNLKVYINNILQRFVLDYVYNGNINTIILSTENLKIGDIVKIENFFRAQYIVNGSNITLINDIVDPIVYGDTIEVTWFAEYPTMDLLFNEYTGGKVSYPLLRNPLSIEYIWVYKNGNKLIRDRDYRLSLPRGVVYLAETTTADDEIRVLQFGDKIYKSPIGFEIFKDMLNNNHYKRFARNASLKLTKQLNYFDTQIEVSDGNLLSEPIVSRRVPGVILVNNERIEYFVKTGNILSQLRRGSLGTAIAEVHGIGSVVVDVGATNTLPYTENQERIDFTTLPRLNLIPDGTSKTFELDINSVPDNQIYVGFGDKNNIIVRINDAIISRDNYSVSINSIGQGIIQFGNDIELAETDKISVTPLLIGPLDFVPLARKNRLGTISEFTYRKTIPNNYYPCDSVEVFVSGSRLRKNPTDIYDEEKGITSPASDSIIEADFSVNNESNYVRLTDELSAGTRVTIIRKQGKLWYDVGQNSASVGLTLVDNTNPIARFISLKDTDLPE